MKRFFKLTAIALLTPTLLNVMTPQSVKAENQFDVCLREIVESGVTVDEADTACADALIPKDFSYCVRRISSETEIQAEDALKNCYLVRRPVEMANCVVDIDKQSLVPFFTEFESATETTEDSLIMALATCRDTILPKRHSECVIGLSRTPELLSPVKAMETCISAEDFPKDLFPDS